MLDTQQRATSSSGQVTSHGVSAFDVLSAFSTMGVGSLPHRDAEVAAEFAWTSTTIPTLPSLPRRSPAEGMIAQALIGIEGVTVGQYGGIAVDAHVLERDVPTLVDLGADAFEGYRAFFEAARREPVRVATPVVKWQCVGPLTLALALRRSGLAPAAANSLALRAVRAHVRAVQHHLEEVFPVARQLVVLDEPSLSSHLFDGSELSSDMVVDLVSGALAAIGNEHLSGVHCCGDVDWPALMSIGSHVISVPVPTGQGLDDMANYSSRISDMLQRGGMIAWGVIRTDGPIAQTAERAWQRLSDTWSRLCASGVDRSLLTTHSFFSPACGLGTHTDGVATHVMDLLADVAARATRTEFSSFATPGF